MFDFEFMLNLENLLRVSILVMIKEYFFLCISVFWGFKVGSLGFLVYFREKKIFKLSKIWFLVDYRIEDLNVGNFGGNVLVFDFIKGFLKQNRSSVVFVVFEISLFFDIDDCLENIFLVGDSVFEVDGNDSDSLLYSSVFI